MNAREENKVYKDSCYGSTACSACAQTWESGIYVGWISIIRLTRIKFRTVNGILNLHTVCFIIEYRGCNVCVLVRSSRLIFGQVRLWPESGTVLLVVSMLPLVPGCTI